jgi:two-component system sensor histidine kinase YesM
MLLILFLYLFFIVIFPLIKALFILKTNDSNLFLNKKNITEIIPALQKFGIIGLLIEELAKGISMEPKARMLGAEVALYALQSQINPHFLYNTLDTIRNYALKYGVSEVAEMTQSMASIFRYSISHPGEVATLADEVNNVKAYLKIQWYRFTDRFKFVWDIDEENDEIMKYSLPVLTLQPLVENAIQHGLENNIENGIITIKATTTKSKLIISIEDNGMGISSDNLHLIREKIAKDLYTSEGSSKKIFSGKKSGVSLMNINQRLKLYFGGEGGLSINSIEGFGTSVEIEVPKIR